MNKSLEFIILTVVLLYLFWLVLIRKPKRYCRWYQHNWDKRVEHLFVNTGEFIDGKPIQRERQSVEYECKKCGKLIIEW